jgi:hypothetical protein
MTRAVRAAAAIAVALTLIGGVGCGGGKPAAVPVAGKVLYRKTTPAAGALVVFHPTDPAFEKSIGGKPVATVRDDGTFTLTIYAENDGAPAGVYGVTVDWRTKPGAGSGFALGDGRGGGAPRLNPKFSNPQQPFTTVTVKAGEANEFVFEVE